VRQAAADLTTRTDEAYGTGICPVRLGVVRVKSLQDPLKTAQIQL